MCSANLLGIDPVNPALGGQGQDRHSLRWFQLSPTALAPVISFHSPVTLSLAWKLCFSLFLPLVNHSPDSAIEEEAGSFSLDVAPL